MSWDAGRDSTPGTWTRVPSTSPTASFDNSAGTSNQQNNLVPPNERVQWFFGFPTALVTSRYRHYQWGQVGSLSPTDTIDNQPYGLHQYLRPSTEEFYDGAQTQHPLPFKDLSCTLTQYAGVTEDGTLWVWGNRSVNATANALGLGANETIAQPFERSTPTNSLGHWRTTKFIATTPQPVVGQNDSLADVSFIKCAVTQLSLLALSSDGKLYACGSAGNIFGVGDYYTSGSTGRTVFAYPTLVRFWGLSFSMVGGVFVGTPIENAARVWKDFAVTKGEAGQGLIRLIADDGKIYRRNSSDASGTIEDEQTRAGSCYRLVITDAGYGYTNAPTVTVDASPGGDNLAITATVNINASRQVDVLSVSNWGSGYTAAPTITIAEPTAAEKAAYPTWRRATAEIHGVIPTSNTWASVYAGGFNSTQGVSGIASGRFAIASDGYLYRITNINSSVTFYTEAAFDRLHATKTFTKAAVGNGFLIALATDGGVWSMGTANNGTASVRDTLQLLDAGPWVDIAAGANHGVMINASGEAYAWGSNSNGQLGTGNTTNSATPVKVSGTAKWKRVFAGDTCTMAVRDEQFDAAGNRLETLAFAG